MRRVNRSDGVAFPLSFPFRFLRGLTRVNESYVNELPSEPCMNTLYTARVHESVGSGEAVKIQGDR